MTNAESRKAVSGSVAFGLQASSFFHHLSWLFAALLAASALAAHAQTPTPNQPDPLLQLMMSQPPVDIQSPVVARAAFDPPVIRVGSESIYRVTLNAMNDAITQWPDELVAPAQLQMRAGARGQILQLTGTNYQPLTIINYRVRASAPGSFLVPQFLVDVYGKPVTVPGVRLQVVADPQIEVMDPPRLLVEVADTNVFIGQAVTVRVLAPSRAGSVVQPLSQVQFNGEGFQVDPSSVRQRITMAPGIGREVATFTYETLLTPVVAGPMKLSAQGFSGNRFVGTLIISGQATIPGGAPQYDLLESDPITLNVRPLPREGELAGFTGAIGDFQREPPWLATNNVRVGDPLRLTVLLRGNENLQRLVAPPPPRVRDWQVYAGDQYITNIPPMNPPPGPVSPGPLLGWEVYANRTNPPPIRPGPAKVFTYTLVPLTEESRGTPAIPFSCFDPEKREYVDLTIPSLPVTVLPGTVPTNTLALMQSQNADDPRDDQPKFHGLAKTMGRSSANLAPLQARPGFMFVPLVPVVMFAGLWAWDRRRRYLELHPHIVRRRRARRALRRQRRALREAARAGDAARYAANAVTALQIVCAPHYPAEPRALVCGDVLPLLEETSRANGAGQVVRRFFAVTDAASFGKETPDAATLLGLAPELERVLAQLEAKL